MALRPFFVEPLSLGTITSGNEQAVYPASHLAEHRHIGMVWRSNGASSVFARGDRGVANSIDFVSLLNTNALPATTIRVRLGNSQAEVDGSAPYDSGVQTLISPAVTTGTGRYHSHLELPSVGNYRWWRVDIGSHTGDFEASDLVIGNKLTPARYYSRGFERGVEDLGDFSMTEWGIADISDGLIFTSVKFQLGWLTESEYELQFGHMDRRLGRRSPVYVCFDPEATQFRQSRTYFGWLRDNPFAVGGDLAPGTYSREYSILSMI